MFLIQSVKTKRFYQYDYYQRLSFTDYITCAKSFETPQAATDFINAKCSKTSRSHVVYYDGSKIWNITQPRTS